MTLTLAAPPVSGIVTYESGLKVVRLTDYMGAARGDLSAISDANSPGGDTVYEEQTLAAATTFAHRYTSVADTIVIPIADLAFPPESGYDFYISVRVEGRAPIGARMSERWNRHANIVGPAIAWLYDSSLESSPSMLPRSDYAHYSMVYLGSTGGDGFFPDTRDDLILRAWGITGQAIRLDLAYLVPFYLKNTDEAATINPGDFEPIGLFSGPPDPDEDNDATDNPIGKFSTRFGFDDAEFDSPFGYDYQDADDEPSQVNWRQLFNADIPNPTPSYLTLVGIGSRLINYHLIEDEDFAGAAVNGQVFETGNGYIFNCAGTNFIGANGWRTQPGFVQLTTPDAFTCACLPINYQAHADWTLGERFGRTPFSSTNPSTYAPLLIGVESMIVTAKFTHSAGVVGGTLTNFIGGMRHSAESSSVLRGFAGARVVQTTGGALELSLVSMSEDAATAMNLNGETFDGPVSVLGGWSPGTAYWVKVEKRAYHWRARIWEDGDTEPSTWDVEGYEQFWVVNAGARTGVQYPYDDNWITTGTNSIKWNPIYQTGSTAGYVPGGFALLGIGFNSSLWTMTMDDLKVEYDPDTDEVGDYTGAEFRLEKYDGTTQFGSVAVDPGALRVAYSDYDAHHFNVVGGTDEDGGNLFAWREPGGHTLQTAVFGNLYARWFMPTGRPQIYRRVFG